MVGSAPFFRQRPIAFPSNPRAHFHRLVRTPPCRSTLDTVRNIALLARIRVADETLEPLARELSAIIGWVEQLSEVNTDDVAPMTSVTDITPELRADVVNDGDRRDAVLANAPDGTDGFYTVPKVVE